MDIFVRIQYTSIFTVINMHDYWNLENARASQLKHDWYTSDIRWARDTRCFVMFVSILFASIFPLSQLTAISHVTPYFDGPIQNSKWWWSIKVHFSIWRALEHGKFHQSIHSLWEICALCYNSRVGADSHEIWFGPIAADRGSSSSMKMRATFIQRPLPQSRMMMSIELAFRSMQNSFQIRMNWNWSVCIFGAACDRIRNKNHIMQTSMSSRMW